MRKVQIKTNDGLVYFGDLIEQNSLEIIINNTTFMIEGNNSVKYDYINKINFSRKASLKRKNIIWFTKI